MTIKESRCKVKHFRHSLFLLWQQRGWTGLNSDLQIFHNVSLRVTKSPGCTLLYHVGKHIILLLKHHKLMQLMWQWKCGKCEGKFINWCLKFSLFHTLFISLLLVSRFVLERTVAPLGNRAQVLRYGGFVDAAHAVKLTGKRTVFATFAWFAARRFTCLASDHVFCHPEGSTSFASEAQQTFQVSANACPVVLSRFRVRCWAALTNNVVTSVTTRFVLRWSCHWGSPRRKI